MKKQTKYPDAQCKFKKQPVLLSPGRQQGPRKGSHVPQGSRRLSGVTKLIGDTQRF